MIALFKRQKNCKNQTEHQKIPFFHLVAFLHLCRLSEIAFLKIAEKWISCSAEYPLSLAEVRCNFVHLKSQTQIFAHCFFVQNQCRMLCCTGLHQFVEMKNFAFDFFRMINSNMWISSFQLMQTCCAFLDTEINFKKEWLHVHCDMVVGSILIAKQQSKSFFLICCYLLLTDNVNFVHEQKSLVFANQFFIWLSIWFESAFEHAVNANEDKMGHRITAVKLCFMDCHQNFLWFHCHDQWAKRTD